MKSPHCSGTVVGAPCICDGCEEGAKADMSPNRFDEGCACVGCWGFITLLPAVGDKPLPPGGGASLGGPPLPGAAIKPIFPRQRKVTQ